MSEWTGRLLGKVRLGPLIARGGMAEVYLGLHTTLQRDVAVKILRAQYQDDPDLLERFQREARVVAKLRHQNIVQVFDYDTVDDHPYIVMEYIQGPSLSKYLATLHKRSANLELPEIARILTGVAQALQYAHDSGVIHRDIKPGNILLTSHTTETSHEKPLPRDFQPVLTDFGLVRFLNSARQTTAGQTAGTPAYMSPEQARGEVTDGRTDIYSLGIVLYEMLAGNIPFDGETTVSILMKHITDPPPPIPGLSVNLQKVLTKALAKNRDARFQKLTDFAAAFNAAVSGEIEPSTFMGMVAVPEPEPVPIHYAEPVDSLIVVETPKALQPSTTQPPARRRWGTAAAIGAIALLGVSGLVFLMNGSAATLPPTATVTAAPPTLTPTATQRPIIGLTGITNAAAILHFKNANAVMDQAWLEILSLPEPPAGSQYEAFLVGSEERISLGIPELDNAGKGELFYTSESSENLLTLYDQIEIVLKPENDTTGESETVVYSYTLPEQATANLRLLLVSSPDSPPQVGSVQALDTDSTLIGDAARDLKNALAADDEASVRKHAETILNVLVGKNSPENQDWNGDGLISNPGTGFGFLNAEADPGHLRGISTYANQASDASDASQSMIYYGGRVRACTDNLNFWIPELVGELQNTLAASSPEELRNAAERALALIEQVTNGEDLNQNGIIEPITGECGVPTLYNSVYAMADMPLFPIDVTATATAGSSSGPGGAPTSAGGNGGNGGGGEGGGSVQPTQHVPPGQANKTPKPPKDDNPGGGNNSGNNNKP